MVCRTASCQRHGGKAYLGNGYIGGIIMMNFTRMERAGWELGWRQRLRSAVAAATAERQKQQPGTPPPSPKLNDQDMLNTLFSLGDGSKHVHTLPCQWNLQYHAWLDQLRICGEGALGCAEAEERRTSICRRRPAVVHFMAQSYRTAPSYYTEFWSAMEKLPVALLVREEE